MCCFEVSNDRQIAVRANGRGQPGMMGTQREQSSAAQRRPTLERRHTALLQCSHRGGGHNECIKQTQICANTHPCLATLVRAWAHIHPLPLTLSTHTGLVQIERRGFEEILNMLLYTQNSKIYLLNIEFSLLVNLLSFVAFFFTVRQKM